MCSTIRGRLAASHEMLGEGWWGADGEGPLFEVELWGRRLVGTGLKFASEYTARLFADWHLTVRGVSRCLNGDLWGRSGGQGASEQAKGATDFQP